MHKILISTLIGMSLVIASVLITPQTAGAADQPPVSGCSTLEVSPCQFVASSAVGGYVALTSGPWRIYRTVGTNDECANVELLDSGDRPGAGALTLSVGETYCVAAEGAGAVSAGSATRPAATSATPPTL